jgi:hypothetical protein
VCPLHDRASAYARLQMSSMVQRIRQR